MGKKKVRSKKEIITMVAIAVLVLIIAFLYIRTIRNGGDTSQLTEAIINSVVGEDASSLIGQAVGVDVSGQSDGDIISDILGEDDNPDQWEEENVTDSSGDDTSHTGDSEAQNYVSYRFRNNNLLSQHYDKHGKDMGFKSKEDYEKAASDVINNPNALHKTEKEDGDYVYYVEATNEFVILSTDGYIRTYFLPDAGIKYYNKQ